MDKDELSKVLKYSNSNEIYVVDESNRLIILHCPFRVKVIKAIGEFSLNDTYEVSKVKVTPKLITVFLINEKAYFYFYFEILL